MKKILTIAAAFVILQSCGGSGEGGTVNDGIKTVDTNGALNDNPSSQGALTDTTNNAIENKSRVDIQQRDTSTRPGQ
jgi:hypothetical protein